MSDLPKAVGRAHRAALRNYTKNTPGQKDIHVDKPAQKAKQKKSKTGRPDQGLKETDVNAFSNQAERCFVELIKDTITEDGGPIPINVALQEAAYELNISVLTAQRYLLKFTARRAPFMVKDGYVSLRSAK